MLLAVLIVKNESEWLPGCLDSLSGAVDAVVVCDTGSTDSTRDIALAAGAIVTDFTWCDDFAAARNAAAAVAREAGATWVLSIDADERLELADKATLDEILSKDLADVFELPIYNLEGSVSSPRRPSASAWVPRLFKPGHVRWHGRIHEQLRRVDASETSIARLPSSVASLEHLGYCVEFRKPKGRRNLAVAEKMFRENRDSLSKFELARASVLCGDPGRARDLHTEVASETEPGSFLWRSSMSWLSLDAYENKQHSALLGYAETMLEANSGSRIARFYKGLALFHLGLFDQAVSCLAYLRDVSEDAVVIEDSTVLSTLARATARSGADATSSLVDCLTEDPYCQATHVALLECLALAPESVASALSFLDSKVTIRYMLALTPEDADLLAEAVWQHGSSQACPIAWFLKKWQTLNPERAVLWAARAAFSGADVSDILTRVLEKTDSSSDAYLAGTEVLKEITGRP